MPIAATDELQVGDAVVLAASTESEPQTVEAQVLARQEFAGRWVSFSSLLVPC